MDGSFLPNRSRSEKERTSDPPSGPSTSSIDGLGLCGLLNDSYLVDPASRHMLVAQRLSHACTSTNLKAVKPRMAH